MTHPACHGSPTLNCCFRATGFALAPLFLLTTLVIQPAAAQTLTVLHAFTGGDDGAYPYAGLTMDRRGNLYGTAEDCDGDLCGGFPNGTVYQLSHKGAGWIFNVLYTFRGGDDGYAPAGPVTFGPDGSLYGTTHWGGSTGCVFIKDVGCGTVFNLKPPPTACKSALCPWTETVLYRFTGGSDGRHPYKGSLSFDPAGNLYGTNWGWIDGGTVYELSPSNNGWSFTVLYNFMWGNDGATPYGGVFFDKSGNLWGTTAQGGLWDCGNPQLPDPCGVLYELVPSRSGWTENTAVLFDRPIGGEPVGELISDPAGNLYGVATVNGPGGSGVLFEYTPSGGAYNILFPFTANTGYPFAGLLMDAAGTLYGTTASGGGFEHGTVFKFSGGKYTVLHDFAGGVNDGAFPTGTLIMDAKGNLYGTTLSGGVGGCYGGCGTIWEITP